MTSYLLCLALTVQQPAPAPIAAGTGSIEVEVDGYKLEIFTYKPKTYTKDSPVLVVCHGTNRNADEYRDFGRVLSERKGLLVVAPKFDNKRFPNAAYHDGGITKKGAILPVEKRTGSYLAQIVEHVRKREGRPFMPFYLWGHSAGGQFLSRSSGFVDPGAKWIVAANPGAHLFPTTDMPFPYGFGKLPKEYSTDEAIRHYLAQPLTIYVGTADTGKAQLPMGETAMKQGPNRYERGKNCFKMGQEVAKAKGWEFNWHLVEAPDIAHDGQKMLEHENCIQAIFGKRLTVQKAALPPEPFGLALWGREVYAQGPVWSAR